MELNFKEYMSALNAPGRAGQHFWKPETPVLNDPTMPKIDIKHGTKHLKGVHLNSGFRPLYPAPFRGVTSDKFGIKVKRVPKPSEGK